MSEKAVFITGAAGGIGSALVSALAERGWTVYAGVRATSGPIAEEPRVRPVTVDVTDPASVAAAAEEIRKAQGGRGLQAVVNNAGIIVQGPVELVPDSEWQRQFDVNVFGAARVMRAFLPLLRAGSGRVVNVSAVSAQVAMPFYGPIAASKAALESLSEAARVELAAWGIPVVVVQPGTAATEIFAKAEAASTAALAEAPPERVALYEPGLDAFGKAMGRLQPGPVDRVVKALVTALEARRPKPRYRASLDARAMAALARLSLRTRARLLARVTGLAGVPAPAPEQAAAGARSASHG